MPIARPYFEWNSTNLSDHTVDVTFEISREEHDDTRSDDTTRTTEVGLIMIDTLSVTFLDPSGSGGPEATIYSDFNGGTARAVEVRPQQGTVSSSNPKYEGNFVCTKLPVVVGAVGDQRRVTYEFKATGAVTRATS